MRVHVPVTQIVSSSSGSSSAAAWSLIGQVGQAKVVQRRNRCPGLARVDNTR